MTSGLSDEADRTNREFGRHLVIVYPEIVAFGGEERVLLSFSAYLGSIGVAHTILCYQDRIDLLATHAPHAALAVLRPGSGLVGKVIALRRWLKSNSPAGAVILAFGPQAAAHLYAARQRDYFVRIADTPSMLALSRASRPKFSQRLRSLLQGWLAGQGMKQARKVIVNADYLGKELRNLYGIETDTVYIAPSVSPSDAPRVARAVAEGATILSVCRLESNKRLDWLIEAFAILCRRWPERQIRLVLIGDGSQRTMLEELAAASGCGAHIAFRGFATDAEVEAAYADADIFVMPGIQGFGLPALEALARGVPVVLHRENGVSEILSDTAWVRLVEAPGAEPLAKAMEDMFDRLAGGQEALGNRPQIPTQEGFGASLCRHLGLVVPSA